MSLSLAAAHFDAVAEVYDTQANPLLALEQRILGPRIGNVRGLDVIDVGCGTGRWLQRLADCSARSLLGVDISSEMLLVAAGKQIKGCDLRLGNCTALPVEEATADLVLSSFVLSYVADLETFAREIYRVARPGATVFVADMHPETEAACDWKRSFQARGSETRIRGWGWSLEQITQALQVGGFKLLSLSEPTFGPEERRIFEECGKLLFYHAAAALPAIYILQLRKPAASPRPRAVAQPAGSILLSGARCALGPEEAATAAVSIVDERIESIGNESRGRSLESHLDLSGYLLLPGLINAHDHLEFGLYPNIGNGPYHNAAEWARDIHANRSSLITRHRAVRRSTCLWWGAIRNLLCGVTTVCHHNPVYAELTRPGFPIRVVSEFGWAHSASFETQVAEKFAETNLPFILHAAEGIDEGSAQEIFYLDRIHALSDRTVLVHGLACTPEAIALINQRRAAMILCPTSNEFLFHRSPSLAFIRSLNTSILGSDSPLTAAGDLLDEIRFVHSRVGLDANSLYAMVTTRPAEVLRRRRGEGCLRTGSVADVLVVRDAGLSPAETLAQLTSEQIELVMLAGRVQLASPALIERLPGAFRQGLELFELDGKPRWVRAPIGKLLADAEEALGSDLRVGGKRVRHAASA